MKSKITFIDILIVAFFIFAIIAAICRINENISQKYQNLNSSELCDVVFDVTIGADYAHSISSGDTVLDLDSEKFIGKVSDVKFYDNNVENSLDSNNISPSNYVNATITVSADIAMYAEDMAIKDASFIIGEKYKLALPDVAFEGVCVSLEKRSLSNVIIEVRSDNEERGVDSNG